MATSNEIVSLLINGLQQGAMLTVFAFVLYRYTRPILAFFLAGAASVYILFAFRAGEDPLWLLIEVIGLGIYGTMAILGIRRSPWWLAAGWALHPVWDIALHYFGPGHAFAPTAYTISCLTFDLMVAGAIAVGILLGWRQFTLQRIETAGAPTLATK